MGGVDLDIKQNIEESSLSVNFSPMSPKLFRIYPHREEDRGIDLAKLFL
jgi:hypothetical protein